MLHQEGEEEVFKEMAGASSFKKQNKLCVCRVMYLLSFKASALLPFRASCFDFPFSVVILQPLEEKEMCVRVKEQLQEHN